MTACDSGTYCDSITQLARNPENVGVLKNWVAKNVVENGVETTDLRLGGGMWPGIFWYNKKFDWETLGFREGSQVRLVGPKAGDLKHDRLENIQSVFFGEKSRYGILVRLPSSNEFGINPSYLKYVSEDGNIAVVCRPRE